MAIVRVQEKSFGGLSSTPNVTFTTPSTAGNLLLAAVLAGSGQTLSPPGSFSTAVSNININGAVLSLFYRANAPSTSTITAGIGTGTLYVMFIAEYSGLAATSPLDQTNTGTFPASGPIPSGSITTLSANELIVSVLGSLGTGSYASPTGGFSIVDQLAHITLVGAFLEQIVSSTGTYSTSATNAGGGNGVIASFTTGSAPSTALNAIYTGSVF